MRLTASMLILSILGGTANAYTLGSNSVGGDINGIGIGASWTVDSSGLLTESLNGGVGSQTASWNGANGGCIDPFLGPLYNPAVLLKVWTAACSSGFICQNGQKRIEFSSSVLYEFPIGGRQQFARIIEQAFPLGPC